jgi:hypothetical protein
MQIQRRLKDPIAPHAIFYDAIAVLHVASAFRGVVFVNFTCVMATESVDVAPWHIGNVSPLVLLLLLRR